MEKKAWVTPELIALTRNRPEESVLFACKLLPIGSVGPTAVNNWCSLEDCNTFCSSEVGS
jgi:hypothetical protein